MKTIEPIALTSNLMLNKLLLSNTALEYEVEDGKNVITILYEEFVNKRISRELLIDLLYSRYEIDKHISEYNHYTLAIFASMGLEHNQLIHVSNAYFAKCEIIDQFKYLDKLKEDPDLSISLLADAKLKTLSNFLYYHKEYANVFALLDQSICRTILANVNSELIVERRRGNFTYTHYADSQGVITRFADKYEFVVKMPTHRVSDTTKREIKMHFDTCRSTTNELRAKKSNLTLEEVVDLVHLFFEHLD